MWNLFEKGVGSGKNNHCLLEKGILKNLKIFEIESRINALLQLESIFFKATDLSIFFKIT